MKTQPSPRILIVGGVAGGASAACRARRMNEHAHIVLFEKDRHVSFANCGLPYHVGGEIAERDRLLVAKPELLAKRFRIDVRTRHEVAAIDRHRKLVRVLDRDRNTEYEEAYDRLILAPGASPLVPTLPGVESSNVLTLRNLEDTDRILGTIHGNKVQRAVVIGAGYIGLEMVEQLSCLNIHVTLVELLPQVLPIFDAEMAQPIKETLAAKGVALHLGDAVERFESDNLLAHAAVLKSGTRLDADLFILGIGVRPNVKLAQDAGLALGKSGGIEVNRVMQTADADIYAVGDAAEYPFGPTGQMMRIALAGPANRAGRIAADHAVTGRAGSMPSVLGTAIVRVFDKTAAMTGLTRKLARRLDIPARSVIVIANNHAGYFPGAQAMTLKLVYAPDTGRVLGAQAVGGEGVDKRIDVIATAMAFGATVRDLAGLDLAYAPPFGSAKDPVHMAAFAACNQLDGLVKTLDPDADLSGYQVVDVRSPAEVAKAPLADAPHAVAIPIDDLRDRLGELDPKRPTAVSCASGLRSYVAARILMQNGFVDVYNLTGAATLRARAVAARLT
ncbi:MAG: NADH oxidase [Phycisphaera sp.]|nr:NADH oxidase [Phycisphaera sp.]